MTQLPQQSGQIQNVKAEMVVKDIVKTKVDVNGISQKINVNMLRLLIPVQTNVVLMIQLQMLISVV